MLYHREIKLSSDESKFEYVRWHGINYILNQGTHLLGNSYENRRNRPKVNQMEFGTVVSDMEVYSFYVEPKVKNKIRNLKITLSGEDSNILENKIDIILNK